VYVGYGENGLENRLKPMVPPFRRRNIELKEIVERGYLKIEKVRHIHDAGYFREGLPDYFRPVTQNGSHPHLAGMAL
jgi:hypothetical protein